MPFLFLGTGEKYEDIEAFSVEGYLDRLLAIEDL
jgi:signal recognition particle GTPase